MGIGIEFLASMSRDRTVHGIFFLFSLFFLSLFRFVSFSFGM